MLQVVSLHVHCCRELRVKRGTGPTGTALQEAGGCHALGGDTAEAVIVCGAKDRIVRILSNGLARSQLN